MRRRVREFQSREDGESTLHGADGGDAALGLEIDTDVGLDEARGSLLEAVDAGVGGIDGGTALVERLLLGIDADLAGLEAGHTHLEVDKRLSGLPLEDAGQHGNITDRRTTEVAEVHLLDFGGDDVVV